MNIGSMGRIITCVGEENIGVTTTSIMLAKTLALTDKTILLLDFNYKKPDIYKFLSDSEELPKYNIDLVMNYAVSEKNLKSVIESNTEKMSNSKLHIIMGSNIRQEFDKEQYINFLNAATSLYDFIIIDAIINLNECVRDYSDLILLVVDQCNKNLDTIKRKYWDILDNTKTELVINKFDKNILNLKKVKSMSSSKKIHKLNYDPAVVNTLNNRMLNIDDGEYEKAINTLSKYILKKYNVSYREKKSIFSFFRKKGVNINHDKS